MSTQKKVEKMTPPRRWPYSLAESDGMAEKRGNVPKVPRNAPQMRQPRQPRDPSAHRAEVLD